MPRPPIDLSRKIKDILGHVEPLPPESAVPIRHYDRTANDIWKSLAYVERAFEKGNRYPTVVDRHLGRLYGMALVQLIEAFERFLKEVAAACVDRLATIIGDDRFGLFTIKGSALASHFGAATLGKSLCESATWLDCEEVNKRFRKLLSDPFQEDGKFWLFPSPYKNHPPADQQSRYEPMGVIWQLRHTAVHNVGVITRSDAVKLRLLAREPVSGDVLLAPTWDDLRHLRRFLDETATVCNERVGKRLADLLTLLHDQTPGLFVPQEMADRLAADFRLTVVVAGATGVPPPD